MTTLTSTITPTVPIRIQMIEHLTREFGKPASGERHERRVLTPPTPRHPVHVIVNGPSATDRAHVMVFDPSAPDGDDILEMALRAIDELSRLVEHFKQSVAPGPKHVVATEPLQRSFKLALSKQEINEMTEYLKSPKADFPVSLS